MADQDRWREVSDAFERLVLLEPEQRERELTELRASDADVAREVEALLEHDEEGFLDTPIQIADAVPVAEGIKLGSFTLVHRIGVGGMGEVWEAQQDVPARRVAIKVLAGRGGLQDTRERARFDLEAEALSRLQHPSIAQVHGAGAERFEGGVELAWIAMELMSKASDILTWCSEQRLELAGRLDLFLTLCGAVRHGHARGVLHRDIKPANILVAGSRQAPVLKLIDFGIARLIDADRDLAERTRTGEFLGTLSYMAPEQLAVGGAHDVRTDVYALGVVLYRLLTGEYPIPQEETDLSRFVRMLATAEPTPLSQHAPHLAGDLEWVVAKALEKDPNLRYANVDELIDDLERYRDHRPTLAGPQTRMRAALKFVRRNRVACLVASTIAVTLFASLWLVTTALFEARYQAEVAQKEVDKNTVVQDLIDSLFFGVSDSIAGRNVRVLDLLDLYTADFEPEDHAAEVEFRFRTVLGGLYHTLGSYAQAKEQLRTAVALLEGEGSFDDETRLQAHSLLGSTLRETGSLEEGEAMLDQALAEAEELGLIPTAIDVLRLRLKQLERDADYQSLLEAAEHGIELAAQVGDEGSVRVSREYRGIALSGLGRKAEARDALAELSAQLLEERGSEDPLAVRAFANYAVMLHRADGPEAAEDELARAVRDCERVLGADAMLTLTTMNNYANLLNGKGDTEEAAEILMQVIDAYDAMESPPEVDRVRTLNNLGMAYRNSRMYEEAEPVLRRAVVEAEELFQDDDWNLAVFRLNFGSCLAWLRRLEEGEPYMLQAWDVLRFSEDALGVRHPSLRSIAKAYEVNGRYEDQRFWREILESDPDWQAANGGQ